MTFSFADLLTAAGAASAATLALVIVQLLKAGIPGFFDKITGGTMAFVVTALIYIVGGIVLTLDHTISDANGYLSLLLGWLTAAAAALGLHSVANNGAATFVQGADKDTGPPPT